MDSARDVCYVDHHEVHADFANHRGFLSTDNNNAFAAIVAVDAVKIPQGQDSDLLLGALHAIASAVAYRFPFFAYIDPDDVGDQRKRQVQLDGLPRGA